MDEDLKYIGIAGMYILLVSILKWSIIIIVLLFSIDYFLADNIIYNCNK